MYRFTKGWLKGWMALWLAGLCLLGILVCHPTESPAKRKRPSPIAVAETPPPAAQTDSAQEVFRRLKELVFEVRTTAGNQGQGKASYGTAFVVDKEGLLITNYHVVAMVLMNRQRHYKVHVRDPKESNSQEAQVLGVDLVHDLALLRVPRRFAGSFTLSETLPTQGQRLYSMGIPQDLNLSIIEGVCNDFLKNGPYERLHVSSPLNAGMSGGPTINGAGDVVGVNVAILREANNISFSVPGRFARALLAERKNAAPIEPFSEELHKLVAKQMTEVQAELTKQLVQSENEEPLEGWYRGGMPSHVKCWSSKSSDDEERPNYQVTLEFCSLGDRLSLDEQNMAGSYFQNVQVFDKGKLNRLQLYDLLNRRFNGDNRHGWDRKMNTHFDCNRQTVVGKGGVPLRVAYCMNAYNLYPGLYDFTMRVAALTSDKPLLLDLNLSGFRAESIEQIVAARLDRIRRAGGN